MQEKSLKKLMQCLEFHAVDSIKKSKTLQGDKSNSVC